MSGDAASFPGGEDPGSYHARRPVVSGQTHVVSTGHYLATQAGFQVLEAGGNAVDAGVAAGLALGVVHSDQVNVAGVAPMIIWMAEREELLTIDGLGGWPRAASAALFQRDHGGEIPEGLLRTVVPGGPAAWIEALRRFGTMSFGDVAMFAARFAREGFVMYPFLHDQLRRVEHKNARIPSNSAVYLPGGRTPAIGDLFVQSDLGRSLQYMIDQERAALGRGGDRAARTPGGAGCVLPRRPDAHDHPLSRREMAAC